MGKRRGREGAIEFVLGAARFVDEHQIEVGGRRLSFAKAIIATGARRVTPPVTGLTEPDTSPTNPPFISNSSPQT